MGPVYRVPALPGVHGVTRCEYAALPVSLLLASQKARHGPASWTGGLAGRERGLGGRTGVKPDPVPACKLPPRGPVSCQLQEQGSKCPLPLGLSLLLCRMGAHGGFRQMAGVLCSDAPPLRIKTFHRVPKGVATQPPPRSETQMAPWSSWLWVGGPQRRAAWWRDGRVLAQARRPGLSAAAALTPPPRPAGAPQPYSANTGRPRSSNARAGSWSQDQARQQVPTCTSGSFAYTPA